MEKSKSLRLVTPKPPRITAHFLSLTSFYYMNKAGERREIIWGLQRESDKPRLAAFSFITAYFLNTFTRSSNDFFLKTNHNNENPPRPTTRIVPITTPTIAPAESPS